MQCLKIFITLFLFIPLCCYADIYKWTDADGIVHYSDTPQAGATRVHLPSDQSYHPAAALAAPLKTTTLALAPFVYTVVRITQPVDHYTYVNNEQGKITVKVRIQPALQNNHKLQATLDGKPVGEPSADAILNLSDIERGLHTLQVQIITATGDKVLANSNKVTFTMQRPLLTKQKNEA